MQMLVWVYVLTGLLFVALGVPLAVGRVPPNSWYGFRVSSTLQDPNVWYRANAISGSLLIALGVITVAAAVLVARRPAVTAQSYALILTGILAAGAVFVALLSWVYVRAIAD